MMVVLLSLTSGGIFILNSCPVSENNEIPPDIPPLKNAAPHKIFVSLELRRQKNNETMFLDLSARTFII